MKNKNNINENQRNRKTLFEAKEYASGITMNDIENIYPYWW